MTTLKPGDIRQPTDLIEPIVLVGTDFILGQTHQTQPLKRRPVAPWTVGRVILPADLMTANYYRP